MGAVVKETQRPEGKRHEENTCCPAVVTAGGVGCGEKQLDTETLVGTYEGNIYDDTERWILHENGEFEWSSSDKRCERSLEDVLGVPPHGRWIIAKHRELHLKWYGTPTTSGEEICVFTVNPDNSITHVADITDGDRQDYKEDLDTFQQTK